MKSKKNNVTVNWELVLECLDEISDIAYQRQVWVKDAANEVSGLEDTVAALFDDSALDFALERYDEVFSSEVDSSLRMLGKMIGSLNRECPTEDIIETESWARVRELAERIYRSIKHSKTDQL